VVDGGCLHPHHLRCYLSYSAFDPQQQNSTFISPSRRRPCCHCWWFGTAFFGGPITAGTYPPADAHHLPSPRDRTKPRGTTTASTPNFPGREELHSRRWPSVLSSFNTSTMPPVMPASLEPRDNRLADMQLPTHCGCRPFLFNLAPKTPILFPPHCKRPLDLSATTASTSSLLPLFQDRTWDMHDILCTKPSFVFFCRTTSGGGILRVGPCARRSKTRAPRGGTTPGAVPHGMVVGLIPQRLTPTFSC